jgi:hypothetical protein
MNQEHVETISRTLAAGLSRRGVLRALSVVGASGIVAVVGQAALAGERPHERLQDRTSQRNRKQRNNRRNNNNQNNNQNNNNATNDGGGRLGAGNPGSLEPSPVCAAQCQEQFEGCLEPCGETPGASEFCVDRCTTKQSDCLAQCPTA